MIVHLLPCFWITLRRLFLYTVSVHTVQILYNPSIKEKTEPEKTFKAGPSLNFGYNLETNPPVCIQNIMVHLVTITSNKSNILPLTVITDWSRKIPRGITLTHLDLNISVFKDCSICYRYKPPRWMSPTDKPWGSSRKDCTHPQGLVHIPRESMFFISHIQASVHLFWLCQLMYCLKQFSE